MVDEGLITYETVYEILRNERYKKELQKLDKDFFDKVVRYLNEKRIILQGYEIKDSVFASQSISKIKRQIENVHLLLKELYEKREGKIIQMALFNSRTGSLLQDSEIFLDWEKDVYESIVNALNNTRCGILDKLLEGKKPGVILDIKKDETIDIKSKSIKFLEEVPQFMGEDMTVYGPYKPEDIGNFPEKIALILIKGKKAQEI